MKIAVEGCCHGELDKIYETLQFIENRNNIKVDLLLICGDFQAVRNKEDLQCMAVSQKYQKMNTFYKYYSGEKKAPYLTVFIGGNHEASNFMQELPYGGWVAPNIYYMGYAGVIQVAGIRIGGISGIFKGKDVHRGHFERPPYGPDTIRSAYHVREFEVFRLKQISRPLDIFLSHDWPRGIYNFGNVNQLLKMKHYFREEVESNTLGSPLHQELLYQLKPEHWFAAHLHVKFAAIVQHEEEDGVQKHTKFLSLDKCLPKRKFLQLLDFPHNPEKSIKIELDPEWLVILKSTNHLLNLSRINKYMPGPGSSERWNFKVDTSEMNKILEDFGGDLSLPDNFQLTAATYSPSESAKKISKQPEPKINPQTTLLCTMLDLTDPNAVFLGQDSHIKLDTIKAMEAAESGKDEDVDDDDLDDDDEDTEYESEISFTSLAGSEPSFLSSSNADESFVTCPNEISIEEDKKKKNDQNVSVNPDEIQLSDEENDEDDVLNESKKNVLETSISDDEEFKEMMEQQKEFQSSSSADEKFSSPMKTVESESPFHGSTSTDDNMFSPSKSVSSTSEMEESDVSDSAVNTMNTRVTSDVGSKADTSGCHLELACDDDDPGDILLLKPEVSPHHSSVNDTLEQESPSNKQLKQPQLSNTIPLNSEEKIVSVPACQTEGLRPSVGTSRRLEGVTGDSPQTKKFKRRNHQLYTESTEEDQK